MNQLQSELLNLSLTDFKTSITDSASQARKISSIDSPVCQSTEQTPKAQGKVINMDHLTLSVNKDSKIRSPMKVISEEADEARQSSEFSTKQEAVTNDDEY